jgi:hypothetical protein
MIEIVNGDKLGREILKNFIENDEAFISLKERKQFFVYVIVIVE